MFFRSALDLPLAQRARSLAGRLLNRRTNRRLVALADDARDRGEYGAAALLYEAILETDTGNPGIHMQCAHMHKETRNFHAAEAHYRQVVALAPDDPETHLQLGHFYKVVGRHEESVASYRQAADMAPSWEEPSRELNLAGPEPSSIGAPFLPAIMQAGHDRTVGRAVCVDRSLFGEVAESRMVARSEGLYLTRLGSPQKSPWGDGPTVRGVDALRGYFMSSLQCSAVQIFVDGRLIHSGDLRPAAESSVPGGVRLRKYPFNAWIDFSRVSFGWHELTFRAVNTRGKRRKGIDWRKERIIVAPPLASDVNPHADSVVPPKPATVGGTLEEWINLLPSTVHRASSRSLPVKADRILVLRVDQLGDMVVSVPALRRLRELVPAAHLVGLVAPANRDLAASLGLFDETLAVDFPEHSIHRQRTMSESDQCALAERLAPYKFDVAIDLSLSGVSYKLMPLAGAPVMIGFGHAPWLTLSMDLVTHDPKNHRDIIRHSARLRALVEAFGLWLDSGAQVLRRLDADRRCLETYGLDADCRFVVLHTGARLAFTRWKHYCTLAARILEATDLHVVLLSDDGDIEETGPHLRSNARFVHIKGALPFESFDALLSFCAIFVGNDSGPKHLASLRGADVVSVHSARIDWREWGQETSGVIVSRRVPCAGCGLHYDAEECTKGFVCINGITVDEVLREVMALLDEKLRVSPAARRS